MLTTVEQLLARLGSGIESTPGVCGGDPRIAGTRIPVWTLEHYRRLGLSEARILDAFTPSGLPTWSMPGPMSLIIRTKSSARSARTRRRSRWLVSPPVSITDRIDVEDQTRCLKTWKCR